MKARVFPPPNVCFILLMIVLTLPGCGRGISQHVTKPVPGSQNLSIDEITQMAGQSLQMMGYGIQEQNIPAGYVYARKRVVEDIYGRSTEIKINVQQGQVGEKVLGVEAFSCRGCIPEAHFSPSWMANQFYTFFDLVYKASGRSAGTKASPFQGSPPPGSISGSPPMTGKSAEGPLSAPSPNIIPTPGAVTTMGSLKIIEETRARAEQGNAAAQFNLGVMYANGEGVRQDYAQALVWYRKAAEQGYAPAQFNLGGMYDTGRGVPQDYVEAHMWCNLAASRASGDDQKTYADWRESVAKTMPPQQIAEAQRRAREWKPKSGEKLAGEPMK